MIIYLHNFFTHRYLIYLCRYILSKQNKNKTFLGGQNNEGIFGK